MCDAGSAVPGGGDGTVAVASNVINMTSRELQQNNDDPCCGGATSWIDLDQASSLAARLSAAADPVRLQVLSVIANAPDGEVCACDFVGPLGKSQPTISPHARHSVTGA